MAVELLCDRAIWWGLFGFCQAGDSLVRQTLAAGPIGESSGNGTCIHRFWSRLTSEAFVGAGSGFFRVRSQTSLDPRK